MEKNLLNQNTLIPAMHECARLDMESQVYMLRNTETKRPKTQCAIHNMSLAYLATIQRVKKIKGLTFGLRRNKQIQNRRRITR